MKMLTPNYQSAKKSTMEAHTALTEKCSNIHLCEDCMLANSIIIRNSNSHSIINNDTGIRINYAKNVVNLDHIWIARNCTILRGVASNVFVGSNIGLIRSTDESWVVVSGKPAVIVKRDVSWY